MTNKVFVFTFFRQIPVFALCTLWNLHIESWFSWLKITVVLTSAKLMIGHISSIGGYCQNLKLTEDRNFMFLSFLTKDTKNYLNAAKDEHCKKLIDKTFKIGNTFIKSCNWKWPFLASVSNKFKQQITSKKCRTFKIIYLKSSISLHIKHCVHAMSNPWGRSEKQDLGLDTHFS